MWMIQKWSEKTRRRFVAVSRFNARRCHAPVRSWKMKCRNCSNDHVVIVARAHPSKVVAKWWNVLAVNDSPELIRFDLDNGMLWAGNMLFVMLFGIAQGNPPSPGLAAMVSAWLEHTHVTLLTSNRRWVQTFTVDRLMTSMALSSLSKIMIHDAVDFLRKTDDRAKNG